MQLKLGLVNAKETKHDIQSHFLAFEIIVQKIMNVM